MAGLQEKPSPTLPRSTDVAPRRFSVRVAWIAAFLLVVALVSHPWWLATLVARDLAERSGREVRFDTVRLGLTPSLAPVAVLRGVRIANAAWAVGAVPFASLDEVRFEFAWHRLEGRFVVSKLVLRGGQADLETSSDGRHNWRLRQPDDRGPGHYWFQALEAHGASMTVRSAVTGMEFHGVASDVASSTSASGPLTTRIVFDGHVHGVAYRGDLLTGPELTFRDTGRWFPARGSVDVAGARLLVDGRAADMFLAPRVDADATLDGTSLAALRAFGAGLGPAAATLEPPAHAKPAKPRPYHVAGRLRVADRRVALESAKAIVGATDLAGELALSRVGDRPTIEARLTSDRTDVADLLWLAGRDDAQPIVPLPGPEDAGARHDPFALARRLDLDVAYDARHVSLAAFRNLQSLRIAARSGDGRIAVTELDVGWAGGHSRGHATLDFRQSLAAVDVELETQGVRIEALQAGKDVGKRITGTLAGRVSLKAAGNDVAAMRASASGHAAFTLHAGTIPSLLDAELGLEAGKLVRTFLSGAEPLPLPCAAASATLRDGRAELHDLIVDSANTRTRGSGTIDLRNETVDVVLTPEPKQAGLDLGRSIRLHGRLPKPDRSLIDRVVQPPTSACAAAKS